MATTNEDLNKLLSKMQFMYYQTKLDGSKIDFKEFIEGLKTGESFKGLINTHSEFRAKNGSKMKKEFDSYILIDEGKIKVALYINKNVITGKKALKEIKNPDEIRYTRLSKDKIDQILQKAEEIGITI